jgi:hypothetical protein
VKLLLELLPLEFHIGTPQRYQKILFRLNADLTENSVPSEDVHAFRIKYDAVHIEQYGFKRL